ncbi:MAG: hypothetical protein COU85_00080 [Candidatus Portnoybacteria bacterium CG10_big_fil_rev_8_21_14_0_10_44_7]|uniref:SIMPL domain-containing protein n=1 Tax=Candidatus Portnoybacteria bacterium CG10_big_fil_rev_8_21_14_0_10_44_7 TaxID=1974816 RepID=A0A2M8KJK5_9BACT|nr:MAG: hypothetical protein COU85_00080 [Candidatus Portnoybacteria bacterium CG10_big_fil_rev_8_21_14_0_10_44_7]
MDLSENKKELKLVFWVLAIFLAVMTISAGVGAFNQIQESRFIGPGKEYPNTISVNGQGKVFARADVGNITASVVSEGKTVEAATADNNNKMNQVIAGLKNLGVKEEDIKTTAYNIYPQYYYPPNGQRTLTGYEVRQTAQIKIHDLSQSGEIIKQITARGANEVSSLNFTVDDEESYRQEARAQAIAQAKEKAQKIADGLGVYLGKAISFYEDNSVPQPQYYDASVGGKGGGVATPDIQSGENEIVSSVTVTFQIK